MPGTLFKELGSSLDYAHFLRHRNCNPLVQRNAILFREPLGGFLYGEGKLQWIGRLATVLARF